MDKKQQVPNRTAYFGLAMLICIVLVVTATVVVAVFRLRLNIGKSADPIFSLISTTLTPLLLIASLFITHKIYKVTGRSLSHTEVVSIDNLAATSHAPIDPGDGEDVLEIWHSRTKEKGKQVAGLVASVVGWLLFIAFLLWAYTYLDHYLERVFGLVVILLVTFALGLVIFVEARDINRPAARADSLGIYWYIGLRPAFIAWHDIVSLEEVKAYNVFGELAMTNYRFKDKQGKYKMLFQSFTFPKHPAEDKERLLRFIQKRLTGQDR